jgi:drug/metabolite transporter (DMT)-like permease
VFARSTRQLESVTRRELGELFGLSVFGIALNQALYLWGLRVTTPTAVSLLGITIPVMSAALAVIAGHERATWRMGVGLLVAASGVAWLTGVRSVDRGALIVLLNCLSYSGYVVFSRRLVTRLGAVTVMTWIFTSGALLFAPLGAPALAGAGAWTGRGWLLVGYVVAVPTILAYLANAWALGRSSASLVTVYIYLQPVITALLAWVQLGQALSDRLLVAAALILVGVGIVASRRREPALPVEVRKVGVRAARVGSRRDVLTK